LITKKKRDLKSKTEKAKERSAHNLLEGNLSRSTELCQLLSRNPKKWTDFSDFLKRDFPAQFAALCSSTEDGFQMAGAKSDNCFEKWAFFKDMRGKNWKRMNRRFRKKEMRPLDELLHATTDVWGMSKEERKLVLGHWKKLICQDCVERLAVNTRFRRQKIEELNSLSVEYKGRFLQNADVIGLTTTGLAMHTPLLHRVAPKTLICEEAGEVLEVIWDS
jgi:hypothetical protein